MYTEKKTIFIDGSSGTAGLRIYDRLAQRTDITLLTLPRELGHDIEAQREMLNRADIGRKSWHQQIHQQRSDS